MSKEGFVQVPGGRVWFQVVGSGSGIPLLTLHGGPGFTHEYLTPLGGLADERPVVFYDQLGCGKSDRPSDLSLWYAERFVEELVAVRLALSLDEVHILGQSWGGMLATDYLLTRPHGVRSVILASAPLSITRWNEDMAALLAELPDDVRDVYERHEASGTTDCLEYQAAMLHFYKRHVCRLERWPECVELAFKGAGMDVYHTMWGPSEFRATGNLSDYDRTGRLGEINIPTLLTCGRYDEATPGATAWFQSLIPSSELVVFENSAHLAHVEETDRYLELVRGFLRRVEARAA